VRRIVFDALDVVLELLPDLATRRRELHRLHQWLLAHELTALITAKAEGGVFSATTQQPFAFMQFMVDCSVLLKHVIVLGVSQRTLRVQKYRGSAFYENDARFVIGASGIEGGVAHALVPAETRTTNERVFSGVDRLDSMLGGGFYRGASVLITGFTGTAPSPP